MSYLFLDAQHGLCNRLRAMASGAVVAQATGRELVVIWRPDAHCEARLPDLLDYAGPVIETDLADRLRAGSGLVYNYMEIEEGSKHEGPILAGNDASWTGDVYIRSAYPLKGPYEDFGAEQRFLRRLRPAYPVLSLMNDLPRAYDVTAHIRMAGGKAFEFLAYENASNWPEHRHRELAEWRGKSHSDRFIRRLDVLLTEGQAETIFAAADLPETYAILARRYGSRLHWLKRDLYDRSPRQLQYALADLLLLTAGRHFLGSPWSSFTDVAQRLASPSRPFEVAGIDF